ncbi:efflux transporter outer membrane subunit [Gluconacetobacter azotocaptans]|uniref:efflux transporter outer membrane subunit n=1 Tax=Gluconacetobacter azotocaptans TaxID=142834 RepID=UPI001957A2C5|nr:efflux transporter outer membrane subunit [Gluconacetobacter azotocaptans]MBM9402261.1 efflux transporter outer membrane subunit [Gluconacetobacter azotocaptans]
MTRHGSAPWRSARVAGLVVLAMAGPGCTLGPDFRPPPAALPAAWHDRSAGTAAAVVLSDPDPAWWRLFGDPVLTGLMARAMADNLDVGQALARIAQARAQEQAQRAAGLPGLDASAGYTRAKLGEAGLFSVFGGGTGANGQAFPESGIGGLTQGTDLYQVGFDASWELDLFGQVRRGVEQAGAQAQARIENRRDALVTLQGDVARTYLELRAAQALLAVAQGETAARADLLALTQLRHRLGLADRTDVDQARDGLTRARAALPPLVQQAEQAMNDLAVLTGQPPGALDARLTTARPLPDDPVPLAIGLPAALARRRPDIRAAEAGLHAATAGIGVAVAQFYPDLTLTGQFGQRSLALSDVAEWGNSFYQLGPAISLPLFQGGRLRANLRLARAQAAEAALAYRQAVLNALRDMDDGLSALHADRTRRQNDDAAVATADDRLALAHVRWRDGLGDRRAVLDDQATLAAARQDALRGRLQVLLDIVALYKAAGGGWQAAPDEGKGVALWDP